MNGIFTMNFLGDWINSFFQSVMLWFDSVIYWFAAQCYQLFMKLSMAQIFDNNFYNNFANRIYSILGVFMLFYLAYALLNALVDPEKLAKGDKSVSKLASNLVISLVILGLLPSIFEYAYRLQNYILSSNVIGSLVFGTPTIDVSDDNENSMIRYGDAISFTVLNTFLNSDNYNVRLGDSQKTWFDVKYEILHDGNYGSLTGLAKPIVEGANVVSGKNAGQEVYIVYKVVISTIAGVYLCYIMLSFTLDLGVRVAKLAFCQLVAPIPVIMRAMPGKKGTFDNWLKLTLSVFFEIFVRVAIMYISIYLINGLVESDMWSSFFSGGIQGMIALVIIIMGILTFAKQAPKMISDVLGIDSGSLKLGIGEKIKGSGLFQGIAKGAAVAGVGGAMIGAGVTGLVRNFGKNGIGKSTLLKKIAETLFSRTDITVGYMPQNYEEQLNQNETPVQYLSVTGEKEELTQIRTYLGSMKYTPDEMDHAILELSGGQKAKLFLLKMSLLGCNVLILDEPTRNLSPLSNPVIRKSLRAFPGAIISVSHDRVYIEEVCDRIYEFTKEGLELLE